MLHMKTRRLRGWLVFPMIYQPINGRGRIWSWILILPLTKIPFFKSFPQRPCVFNGVSALSISDFWVSTINIQSWLVCRQRDDRGLHCFPSSSHTADGAKVLLWVAAMEATMSEVLLYSHILKSLWTLHFHLIKFQTYKNTWSQTSEESIKKAFVDRSP